MSLSHPLDWEFLWTGVPDMALLRIGTTKCSGLMIDEETGYGGALSEVTQQVGRTIKASNQVSLLHSVIRFWCVTKNRKGVTQNDAIDLSFPQGHLSPPPPRKKKIRRT